MIFTFFRSMVVVVMLLRGGERSLSWSMMVVMVLGGRARSPRLFRRMGWRSPDQGVAMGTFLRRRGHSLYIMSKKVKINNLFDQYS